MNWEEYKQRISAEAKLQGKNEAYISAHLVYAKKLFDQKLPVIDDPAHFSALAGVRHKAVCRMAYAATYFYRSFTIKKSNGKDRVIDAPAPELKRVQRWILDEILAKVKVSPQAKAFVAGRNLRQNAAVHRAGRVLVTLDIKDFFPSIKIAAVYRIFAELGYRENIASFLANLCCLDGKLPQGAPTSPYLANLRLRKLDEELSGFCRQHHWRYTRYADDMTFSGEGQVAPLIKFVSQCVYNEGFALNAAKTRVAGKNARQEVTGIVVNEQLQIPKQDRREIRQQLYYIKKFGLASHLEHIKESRENYILHLLGRVSFGLFVNPQDESLQKDKLCLQQLYQRKNDG